MRFRIKDRVHSAGWYERYAWYPRWVGDQEYTGFGYDYSDRFGTWIWLEKYEHYWNSAFWSYYRRRLIPKNSEPQ